MSRYTFHTCAPLVFQLDPVSGPVEGGTVVTISGSNLGQRAEDIQNSVTVAGVPCSVIHSRYEVSSRQAVATPEHKLARKTNLSCNSCVLRVFILQDSVRDHEQRRGEERPGLGQSEGRGARTVRSDLQLPGKTQPRSVCL